MVDSAPQAGTALTNSSDISDVDCAGICLNELGQFDWAAVEAELSRASVKNIDSFRNLVRASNAALRVRFNAGADVDDLLAERTRFVDLIVTRASAECLGKTHSKMALLAVGGYGRGELHPGSDVDLMLLASRSLHRDKDNIAEYFAFLWDIGLDLAPSVRTVAECKSACRHDLTIATTLMESRLLSGPEKLYAKLKKAIEPPGIWPARSFFEAKLKEQQARHHQYDDTAYNLEPNIKGSPGGLRDIQSIVWIAIRHFGTGDLAALVELNFLTKAQLRILLQGRSFLWRIRFALHVLTDRKEDRLLFEHQIRIAEIFGYEDATYTLAVEQLMQRYYRTVMDISRLNEMLLQLFQEAILLNPDALAEPLTKDFSVKNGFLQVSNDDVFSKAPSALLEIFLLLQQYPELKGVSAHTIALIRRNLHLINDEFRITPRNHRLFLSIIKAPAGVTHELRRMNLYGVLGQYIPSFGRIVGRMQYDLFHAYTVDEHTLFVVSNLRRFALKRYNHEFPRCSEIMQSLPAPEIAYLGGLFHDIAKGRGGDHSELGAVSAEAFCLEHGMSVYDARLVAWLVRHHLDLSTTAQKKDINDPEVIQEFARMVGDEAHLSYLYLLTVADVRGTSPKLWNSWKAQLFEETYENTKRALRHGLETPIDQDQLLQEKRQQALTLIRTAGLDPLQTEEYWNTLGAEYLLRCRPDEIAWHTQLSSDYSNQENFKTVAIRDNEECTGTAVLIHAPQNQFTFAKATAVFDEFGLSVADARLIPLDTDYSLSIYTVLEQDGEIVTEKIRSDKIQRRLDATINAESDANIEITRTVPRQARMFSTPIQVSFSTDQTNQQTIMAITTGDHPGLLAEISNALRSKDYFIRMAKIVTVGERAEDIFYITTSEQQPLSTEQQNELREILITTIDNQG
jgi:[protein-PII] uridylyltransferase